MFTKLLAVLIAAITGAAPVNGPIQLAPAVRIAAPNHDAMPVDSLPGWKLGFNEGFSGDVPLGKVTQALGSRWSFYQDGWPDGGSGSGFYYADKVLSTHDGYLDAWLHSEGHIHLAATLFPTMLGSVTYGRVSVRWRQADQNLDNFLFLCIIWPVTNRARDGELDHPEFSLGHNVNGRSFLHRDDAIVNGSAQRSLQYPYDPNVWHTTTTEWSPGLVVAYVDGVEVGRLDDNVGNTPSRWALQMTTLPANPGRDGSRQPDDATSGHVLVDWFAWWSYQP